MAAAFNAGRLTGAYAGTQEISVAHPAVKVQFELDLAFGDAALTCQTCLRPGVPDSKRARTLTTGTDTLELSVDEGVGARAQGWRWHPPRACGMTLFGSANSYADVAALAARHSAKLVVLLRLNHVAHSVSSYRHFGPQKAALVPAAGSGQSVPWGPEELTRAVEEARQAYARLLQFPNRTARPAHFVFYEDMARRPAEVWAALELFLGLPLVRTGDGTLRSLERRASDRPAVAYLEQLASLRAALGGEEWGDMLDPGFDDAADSAEAFEEACRLYSSGVEMSWRGGTCPGYAASSAAAV